MTARNTFTKRSGSTYICDVCGRRTRHTGAQPLGSSLCPQCFELAGLENEVSDGYRTLDEVRPEALALISEIEAKGGSPREAFALFLTEE